MAPTHTNIFIPTVETLNALPKPTSLLARLLAWVVAKDKAYRDRCYLESLTDYELRDVGMSRSDIS